MSDLGVIIHKDRADARVPSQPVAPAARVARREVPIDNRPATQGMIWEAVALAEEMIDDRVYPLQAKIAEARAEISRLELALANLRAAFAEMKAKTAELDFVSERLRVEKRGPPGMRGERGRDGPPGKGERGAQGERGLPAPAIAAWEVRPERFEVVPVYSTGERGPPINLLALFQSYDAAVSELEDRDLTEAAQASRAAVERETEASHWAL